MSDPYDELYDREFKTLDKNIEAAKRLRYDAPILPSDADPADILAALRDVRQRLDSLEVYLVTALRMFANFQVSATRMQHHADDAFDAEITKRRGGPASLTGDYSSAKERQAEANIAIIDDLRAARSSVIVVRRMQSYVDTLKVMHRGLESVRNDYLAALRVHQFETVLDR